jgi:hypothetical protein
VRGHPQRHVGGRGVKQGSGDGAAEDARLHRPVAQVRAGDPRAGNALLADEEGEDRRAAAEEQEAHRVREVGLEREQHRRDRGAAEQGSVEV